MRTARLLLAVALACGAAAAPPAWYACDCSNRSNCQCPSMEPPGGLEPKDTPMFILLTHDDAILPTTARAYRAVCDGRFNPNGCPARATMFTQAVNTDCKLARGMWADGYEIGTHTANHIAMPAGYPKNDTVEEVLGARRFLSEDCGIPAEEIRGFRSPYLVTNPTVRQVLWENGFLFDSTLLETKDSESLSTSFAQRTWPYTYDFGVATNCAWFGQTQKCTAEERWPGLWNVPMWVLQVLGLEFTMDVGYYGGRGVYEPLVAAFEEAYNGNRAPLPIYLHTTWVDKDPSRVDQLKRFADYTAKYDNVYWVTMSQLIHWMQNPVPASQLRLTKNLCTKPEPKPQPQLPQDGANVTLTIAGTWCATQTQVADQASRVVAAVAKLLGRHASEAPFVAAVAGGPGAEEALGEGAFRVASAGAGGGLYRIQSAPGANPFTSASPFNGLADGWLQFEGPSYTSLSTQSADAQEDAGGEHADKGSVKDKGKGALSKKDTNNDPGSAVVVTLAAPSGDPEALYSRATDAEALATLVGELGAMGLVLDREPSVVAFKGGKALQLDAATAPAPAPQPQPVATPAAPAVAASPVAVQAPAGTEATAAAGSDSSGSSGLSGGAIAGIVVGSVAVVAAVAGGAALLYKRRRGAGAPAGIAGSAGGKGAEGAPKHSDPEAGTIAVAATAGAAAFSNPTFSTSPQRLPGGAAAGPLDNPVFESSPSPSPSHHPLFAAASPSPLTNPML